MIKAIQVTGAEVKCWGLYGPIESALKTAIQAEAVRVIPLSLTVHGKIVELELWVDATRYDDDEERDWHGPNVPATAMVKLADLRAKGVPITTGDTLDLGTAEAVIHGPAILTGAGGVDIPNVHLGCLMEALLGPVHPDENGDD